MLLIGPREYHPCKSSRSDSKRLDVKLRSMSESGGRPHSLASCQGLSLCKKLRLTCEMLVLMAPVGVVWEGDV